MNKRRCLGCSVLSMAVAIAATFCTQSVFSADTAKISHVVLIGVDGGGAFFREANTPNMDKIFENGAVSYEVLTSKPTISAQCWGSMLHGVIPEFHGLTNAIVGARRFPEDGAFPSVFRVVRENRPEATLASFCNWDPINYGIIEEGLGVVKGHAGNDAEVTDLVCKHIEKEAPTFTFVQFDDCDHAGHANVYGSPKYMEQLELTDGYVQKIYQACQNAGILDSTLFIVTADHGGAGNSHGGWTDAEKLIMFAATGPGVVKGTIGEMAVRDTASVVLYALGLGDKQPESWTSRVPSGLFEGVEAGERPVYTIQYAFAHRTHEPVVAPEKGVVETLGKDRVAAYFPFDGNIEDAQAKVAVKQDGKLYFVDGYFGQGAQLDDGYVSLGDYKVGKNSFSVAFWIKTAGVDDDPAILSNKTWTNGATNGFVLALRPADIKFNAGNGKARMDAEFALPHDYRDGWVYVVLTVDREAKKVGLSYDFGAFQFADIPAELVDDAFDALPTLNIGQDGTGKYRVGLGAVVDEFVLVDGALNDADVAALKAIYQTK